MRVVRAAIDAVGGTANDGEVEVTLSLGVAATCDMDEADRLLHAADEALYRAKSAGRNKVDVESF